MTATGEVPMEIERRYLVRVEEGVWERLGPGVSLVQGYLTPGSPSVRIRVGEERGAVLTCKKGEGIRRTEVEAEVPPQMAEALLEAAGERVVRKRRHHVGRWELDRFEEGLEGLVLMEVELAGEDDPVPPPPHGVHIICEVTDDNSFTNSSLAAMSESRRRALVAGLAEGGSS